MIYRKWLYGMEIVTEPTASFFMHPEQFNGSLIQLENILYTKEIAILRKAIFSWPKMQEMQKMSTRFRYHPKMLKQQLPISMILFCMKGKSTTYCILEKDGLAKNSFMAR